MMCCWFPLTPRSFPIKWMFLPGSPRKSNLIFRLRVRAWIPLRNTAWLSLWPDRVVSESSIRTCQSKRRLTKLTRLSAQKTELSPILFHSAPIILLLMRTSLWASSVFRVCLSQRARSLSESSQTAILSSRQTIPRRSASA